MVEYLRVAERQLAPKTLEYRKIAFRRFLGHAKNIPASQVTTRMVENYLLSRPTNHNFNKDRTELLRLFNWGFKRLMVPSNPVALVDKLPVDTPKKVIPTPEQMVRMLVAAGPERPLLLVLFHTMARIDKVLRLRWEDVNFEQKAVRLWTRKRRGGSCSNLLTTYSPTYSPKKKEAKFFDPRSSQTVGGSAWESNPPTAFSRRHTGFEVRGPHQ